MAEPATEHHYEYQEAADDHYYDDAYYDDVYYDDYYECEEGFDYYQPSTKDPGSLLFFGTAVAAVLMVAFIPLLVWIGNKVSELREQNKNRAQAQQDRVQEFDQAKDGVNHDDDDNAKHNNNPSEQSIAHGYDDVSHDEGGMDSVLGDESMRPEEEEPSEPQDIATKLSLEEAISLVQGAKADSKRMASEQKRAILSSQYSDDEDDHKNNNEDFSLIQSLFSFGSFAKDENNNSDHAKQKETTIMSLFSFGSFAKEESNNKREGQSSGIASLFSFEASANQEEETAQAGARAIPATPTRKKRTTGSSPRTSSSSSPFHAYRGSPTGFDDEYSRGSSKAGSVLSVLGSVVSEYLANKKKIFHPKGKDERRLNGAAMALKAAFRPHSSPGRTSRAAQRGGAENKPPRQVRLGNNDPSSKHDDGNDSMEIESLHDEPPQNEKSIRATSLRQYKFYRCDGDMRALIRLSVPFTIHSFAVYVFELMEIAVIGKFLGTNELSALIVVDLIFSLSTMFMEGSLTSLLTLCSHAIGAQKYHLAGQYAQIAVLFYQLLLIPFAVLWYFFLEEAILLFKFDQEVATIAVDYARIYFFTYSVGVLTEAQHYLLEVTGHEIYTGLYAILTSLADFLVVFFWVVKSKPPLQEIAIVQLGMEMVSGMVSLVIVLSCGWLDKFWSGFVGNFAFLNGKAVVAFLRTALPLSVGYIIAYGEWQVLAFFAGKMGPAEVSAWGLLGSFWEAIEGVSLAVADAAEVKVANMLGSNQPQRAQAFAHKSLFLGAIISFAFTIPIYALRDILPGLFTKDNTLRRMLSELFGYVCVGNITMMFGSMCWTLLGAQGRYALATGMQFIGSWVVALPLSAVFTLVLNFDLQGLASSVILGYSCSGALNASFLIRSNWNKASKTVIHKGEMTVDLSDGKPVVYDHLDWDDLPKHVRSAASYLGYTRHIWDTDLVPEEIADLNWDELDPEQRDAAALIGYSKEKWDECDSDCEDFSESSACRQEKEPVVSNDMSPISENGRSSSTKFSTSIEDPSTETHGAVDFDRSCPWDNLHKQVRLSAESLGFSRQLWNSGKTPKTCCLSWSKLTAKQRIAAVVLGYTKEKWESKANSAHS